MQPPQLSLHFEEPQLRFVVHEHLATRHHYDLRLEFGHFLLDLILPKGPSLNPSIRRLAILGPQHPKSCLRLERIRPTDPLIAWDMGRYAPTCPSGISYEEAIWTGLHQNKLELTFYGSKLKGGWTLRRFKQHRLFIKSDDEFATQEDIRLQNRSVLTGRTLRDL